MRKAFPVLGLAALIAAGITTSAPAAFIEPTGVSATSYWGPNGDPRVTANQHHTHLIDGIGLSAESSAATHAAGIGVAWSGWHARGAPSQWGGGPVAEPIVDNESLIFDLGGVFDLTNAYIWNMNQADGTNAELRSLRQFDLDVSADGVAWTSVVVNGLLTHGTGSVPLAANNVSFATQSGVRFVRIGADTVWNNGGALDTTQYVGLSEVRFEGTLTGQAARPTVDFANSVAGLSKAISSTDLLQGITPASSHLIGGGVGTFAQTTDALGGDGVLTLADRVFVADGNKLWRLTYALGSAKDIGEINVFSHNTDARLFLDFDVEVTTDGVNWSYIAVGVGNLAELASALTTDTLSVVSLARQDELALAAGITGLRFSFRPTWANGTTDGSIRTSSLIEIDVHAWIEPVAAVPAPAAAPAGLVAVALASIHRRRRA